MDKDATNNSMPDFQLLVDLLKNKNYPRAAVKSGSCGSPRKRSIPEKIDFVPTPKFENQIKELKLQLEQRDAALAERNNIYQQQNTIIKMIVQ